MRMCLLYAEWGGRELFFGEEESMECLWCNVRSMIEFWLGWVRKSDGRAPHSKLGEERTASEGGPYLWEKKQDGRANPAPTN